jgi:8-oxo-dGTP pyrophosphatase MutT (NUDIX family)
VAKHSYHKLPGGGVDPGEDRMAALDREIEEELGCHVEVTGEVGEIIEYIDTYEMVQTSFCYTARQITAQVNPSFTEDEKERGFEIVWVKNVGEAIHLLQSDLPTDYSGYRIKPRDIAFLKAAKELI